MWRVVCFYRRSKKLRKEKKWSQHDLEKYSNITKKTTLNKRPRSLKRGGVSNWHVIKSQNLYSDEI